MNRVEVVTKDWIHYYDRPWVPESGRSQITRDPWARGFTIHEEKREGRSILRLIARKDAQIIDLRDEVWVPAPTQNLEASR